MSLRVRDERDAYVDRLAQKLDTVPPRREPSGVYPAGEDTSPRVGDAPRPPRSGGDEPSLSALYGDRRSAVGDLDEPFRS